MCISVFDRRATDQAVEITLFGRHVRKIFFSAIVDIAYGSKEAFGEVWTMFKLWHLATICTRSQRAAKNILEKQSTNIYSGSIN